MTIGHTLISKYFSFYKIRFINIASTCFIDFTSSVDFSAPMPAISFVNLGYTVCAYASASGSRAVPRPNRQSVNNRPVNV